MEDKAAVDMGTILCKYCNREIGTLNTNRVIKYYGICTDIECLSKEEKTVQIED